MTRTKWNKPSADFIAIKEKEVPEHLSLLNNGEDHGAVIKRSGVADDPGIAVAANNFHESTKGKLYITVKFEDEKNILPESVKEWLISLYLPTESLFFKAKLDIKDDINHVLIFEVTGKVFKIQRRENYRLPIAESDKLTVDFKIKDIDDPITLPMANISPSGIAVYSKELKLASQLIMDTTLVDISFTIDDHKISKIVGVVRHPADLDKVRPKKGYKVGIQLLNLSPTQQRYIAAYILRELSRFFGRP